jgi:hypothetical protein
MIKIDDGCREVSFKRNLIDFREIICSLEVVYIQILWLFITIWTSLTIYPNYKIFIIYFYHNICTFLIYYF